METLIPFVAVIVGFVVAVVYARWLVTKIVSAFRDEPEEVPEEET